jgi:hypothetical protein
MNISPETKFQNAPAVCKSIIIDSKSMIYVESSVKYP